MRTVLLFILPRGFNTPTQFGDSNGKSVGFAFLRISWVVAKRHFQLVALLLYLHNKDTMSHEKCVQDVSERKERRPFAIPIY